MSDHSLPVKAPRQRHLEARRVPPRRWRQGDTKVLPSVYGEQLRYPDGRVEKTK